MHSTADGDAFALDETAPGQLLRLRGRLDVTAAADVRLALSDAVDATGLGVLVGAHRRAGRSGRTLVLHDVPPGVGRLLRRTRLDRVLRQSASDAGAVCA